MNTKLYYNAKIDPLPEELFLASWEKGRYRPLDHTQLVQPGDQYLTANNKYAPVPLTTIGTFPPSGVLIRRPA